MKYFYLLFSVIVFNSAFSQTRLQEYEASNGIVYKEGDTLKLGRGSGLQGTFVHYQMGGWAISNGTNSLGSHFANTNVIIKKIKKFKQRGAEKVWFVVNGGNITNYNLYIEEAIETCEVKDCKKENLSENSNSDKFDKLKKLKTLFDEGVIDESEFKAEKEKLLKK